MKNYNNQKGSALLYAIIAIIVIGAGVIAYTSFSNNQAADNSGTMMEDKSDNAMMEDSKDDAMMEDSKDDSMKEDKNDDAMMEDSKDDAMMDPSTDSTSSPQASSGQGDDSDTMMEDDSSDSMMEDSNDDAMMEDDSTSINYQGAVLAGTAAPLLDFNQDDYDKALDSNKLVALYFYANWCPICKKETSSALYPAFDELTDDDVIGFRVNYNDNQTDNNEEDLAREFGVAYQHTKVFVKNGERILKSPESWDKERYLEELAKY